MGSAGPAIVYRRYRAPTEHGETFADPPLAEVPHLIATNRDRRLQYPCCLAYESPSEAAIGVRRELIQLASDYTRQYRDVSLSALQAADPTILMAGHQPQLFHPGVWYKNFELSRLATRLGAVAVNLIVDNDVVGHWSIRVPAGSIEHPHIENVAIDTPAQQIPFEDHEIQDRTLFNSFSDRVQEHLRPFVRNPLLRKWWPSVQQAADRDANLGRTLARARHQLEGQWGLQTLELPLSRICETTAFRRWMMHILLELQRFQAVYNSTLQEYRRVNHVRSRAHPAPELLADGEWLEAPFWLWTTDRPHRGRLFVRQRAGQLELTDRNDLNFAIPFSESEPISSAVDGLAALARAGVKVRPRALTTTLYARLCLCDLFIHGIGGGKYDQLTDALMQKFFSVTPPHFLVLTATVKLPIESPRVNPSELRRVDSLLREFEHNPDRHVDVTHLSRPMVEAKQRWLTAPQSAGKSRHDGIRQLNRDLQPFVARQRMELLAQRDRLSTLTRNDRLLGARDYAFCLFPESTLQALLLDKR